MRCPAQIGSLRCALHAGHEKVRTSFDVENPIARYTNHVAANGWTFVTHHLGQPFTSPEQLGALTKNPDVTLRVRSV